VTTDRLSRELHESKFVKRNMNTDIFREQSFNRNTKPVG